ncbi:MAG: translation initiation factor IF-3 [Acholeplasmatales bacterium]|nr:translation initiation factor IF-3 [Acholeplasmataceae bacterium]MDY0115262.1 translation initiation factor IF-3 [Acholeplasmatales bacterium]MCK9233623.1 translation initiation factor IF-3 [Acholeplasmataceae bacterium]MCK9289472.1 translation initiation factor IF-3 [Acholeplasmataceae bacterium]MCK9427913.1 translation initiation factor IF-3 [Acholeplasmataceae bacterium]
MNCINRTNKSSDYYNDNIPFGNLLVITDGGENLGILAKNTALEEAYRRELDLVVVSPQSNPPVAKIMDYSKYRYDQQKRLREIKKNQKTVEVKEIRLSPVIGDHDLMTKFKQAEKFIAKGDKVKISLRFRGRMITHSRQGFDVVNRFIEKFGDTIIIEQKPKMEGRFLHAAIAPNIKK